MHVVKLLHNLVKKSCVGIHAKKLNSLFIVVMGLTIGSKLSVAGIGRALYSKAKAKNKIKQVDRLVGNVKLHAKRDKFYSFACKMVIINSKQTPIIIDWSGLPNPNYFLLRAAVPTRGRSLTVYEEVHPKEKQNNHKIHKGFLIKLSKMIPQGCKPVIITDAGFHSPFFGEVEKLGWDFVGRIRNLTKYRFLSSKDWFSCKELYKKASKIPKFIGEVILSKSTPIKCFLFLFKGKKKGRIAKNKHGNRRQSKASKVCAKANKEPWLLATSLTMGKKIAKKVVQFYKKRMQIEEGFRDIKNSRLGFSFEESLTYKPERFEMLLLIAMLAILAVTILGKAGEQSKLQYAYQANTIRNRTVLSLFFLGCQIIKDKNVKFSTEELLVALSALISTVNKWEDINA
ncbi:MAG: IS4 family transposase [Candidatus Berkiella sp.]